MIYVLGQRRGMSPDGMMRLMSKMDDGSTSALLGAPSKLSRAIEEDPSPGPVCGKVTRRDLSCGR